MLVLSEMAGAARELTDALCINQNNIVELASAIKERLYMPEEEQKTRMDAMQRRVAHYNVQTLAPGGAGPYEKHTADVQVFYTYFTIQLHFFCQLINAAK